MNPLHHEALDELFGELFEALSKGEPVTCPTTGIVHPALPRVSCAVIDVSQSYCPVALHVRRRPQIYASRPLELIRKRGPDGVKVYVWYSPAENRLLTWNGPEDAGAKNCQLAELAERIGHNVSKLAAEVVPIRPISGNVTKMFP